MMLWWTTKCRTSIQSEIRLVLVVRLSPPLKAIIAWNQLHAEEALGGQKCCLTARTVASPVGQASQQRSRGFVGQFKIRQYAVASERRNEVRALDTVSA